MVLCMSKKDGRNAWFPTYDIIFWLKMQAPSEHQLLILCEGLSVAEVL